MATEEIMAQMWQDLQSLSPEEKKAWRENLYKMMEEDEKDKKEEQRIQLIAKNEKPIK